MNADETSFRLIDWFGGIVLSLFGILWKMLSSKLSGIEKDQQALTKELSNFKESIPKEYVVKADFKEALDKIETMLQRISDKLDLKLDK